MRSRKRPESNLNVAVHNLRQALQKITDLTVIFFEEGSYRLASNLEIWLDVEEFDHCVKEGKQLETGNKLIAAIAEYEIAISLYQDDLLTDSPYEEWMIMERERLRVSYLDTLDRLSQIHFNQERYAPCVTLCQMILNRDICREDVHSRVMRCYNRLGQTYWRCANTRSAPKRFIKSWMLSQHRKRYSFITVFDVTRTCRLAGQELIPVPRKLSVKTL